MPIIEHVYDTNEAEIQILIIFYCEILVQQIFLSNYLLITHSCNDFAS